jgi:hypothetical protein
MSVCTDTYINKLHSCKDLLPRKQPYTMRCQYRPHLRLSHGRSVLIVKM